MKSENRMMIKHVLIIVLSIVMLISTGIGCYVGIVNLFGVEAKLDGSSMDSKVIATDILLDRQVCNLIYSVNTKSYEIDSVVLEFFDSDSGKMDYVTVPSNTKLVISGELFKKLTQYGYGLKDKVLSLKKLIEVFGTENAYQFGQMVLEDVLGIKISYYTVFSNNVIVKYFVKTPSTFYLAVDKKVKEFDYDMYKLSETYITKTNRVENDITALINQGYKDLRSNFSLSNKLSYLQGYKKAQIELIYYWHVVGKEEYNQFILDKEVNTKLFKYIRKTKTQYKIAQEEYNKGF